MRLRLALAFGFVFLYAPIATLILFSFNASRLVTVWAGFSVKWYGELLANEQMLDAAWLSLRVAATSATAATVLGTLAAVMLVRLGRFPGRSLLAVLAAAPLVLPEVILGLALLLLFVALETTLGWPPERGELTLVLAHTTLGLALATVVIRSRLAEVDPALEEAAMDLGATPVRAFVRVTIPAIAPALAAGWLLAFTYSLDDLVVASFTSGPGASTLPMVVYSSVRMGVSPQVNALATLLVLAVAVTLGAAAWLMRRRGGAPFGL